jgi:hypothetical protein
MAGYTAHPDVRQQATNRLAMIIAASQPTYPLYVRVLAGGDWWLAGITSLSLFAFLAVPWAARRSRLLGATLIPIAGTGNSIIGVMLFGRASGVWAFVIPSALILALAPIRRNVLLALLLTLGASAAVLLAPGPVGHFPAAGLASLWRLNVTSAAVLCAIAMAMRRARSS